LCCVGLSLGIPIFSILGNITTSASHSSVFRMLWYDLKLTPYTISIMQHLKPTDIERRLTFATWMIDNSCITDKIWSSEFAGEQEKLQVLGH
jgi:hypothetical protein